MSYTEGVADHSIRPLTKDEDFVQLQERRGAPPQLVWLTCGNLSNPQLKQLLLSRWERAI
jgi:predicted nuclease of predicted toxin-antitoxin system